MAGPHRGRLGMLGESGPQWSGEPFAYRPDRLAAFQPIGSGGSENVVVKALMEGVPEDDYPDRVVLSPNQVM